MKIHVDDIGPEVGERLYSEPEDEMNRLLAQGSMAEYTLEAPVMVRLSYYRAGMELFFEGEINAFTLAICARCAEEFKAVNKRGFRLVLAPKAVSSRGDADINSEDPDFSFYEGEQIDLSLLIREQVLLALPTRPLCDEQCQGLCPNCGTNLNHDACRCESKPGPSDLAALRTRNLQHS